MRRFRTSKDTAPKNKKQKQVDYIVRKLKQHNGVRETNPTAQLTKAIHPTSSYPEQLLANRVRQQGPSSEAMFPKIYLPVFQLLQRKVSIVMNLKGRIIVVAFPSIHWTIVFGGTNTQLVQEAYATWIHFRDMKVCGNSASLGEHGDANK